MNLSEIASVKLSEVVSIKSEITSMRSEIVRMKLPEIV